MAQPESKKPNPKKTSREWFPGSIFIWLFLFLSVFYFAHLGSVPLEKASRQISYGEFFSFLEQNAQNPRLKSGVRIADELTGELADGVDLIDKNDAAPAASLDAFFCLLKEIPHARGPDADEHFHKI